MRFKMWQRWLKMFERKVQRVPEQRTVRHSRAKLAVEVLEDRQLLALVIIPTFAANINSDVNAATIKSTINTVIAAYQSSFSDNVTVNILFQEGGGLGASGGGLIFNETYTSYYNAISTHKTTADDNSAFASLPNQTNNPVDNTPSIWVRGPLARALGYSAATVTDGTITLNTSICNLDRTGPQNAAKYDLMAVTAHEIDEILASGSGLDGLANGATTAGTNILPLDLYRYDQTGARSYNTTLANQAYFSINGGTTPLARFNQTAGGDFGDWYSPGSQVPQIQDAFGTPGSKPNLVVELRRLDVLGFTRVANVTPVVTPPPTQTFTAGSSTSFNLGSFADADTGPWLVTVNWGDASANTTFYVASAGALGTQNHTYASPGVYNPTVTVTDFTNLSGGPVSFIAASGTTSVSLVSGNLTIQDIATGGKDDNLTIQADTGTTPNRYIISDPTAFLVLDAASTAAGATLSADRHTAFVPFTAVTGTINFVTLAGNDKLTVDRSLGSFPKLITYDGGSGSNTLTGPNVSTTWDITATSGGDISGLVSSFTNVQSLVGGSGQDIFVFTNKTTWGGRIDGGGGSNWLNYANFTNSLTINLATGADSTVGGGVMNISNIIGSAVGNDSLTGNAAGGVLVGHNAGNNIRAGSGASIIIGGYGKNILIGGAGNDIIINGYTTYDSDITKLQSLFTTWKSSYSTAAVQTSSTPLKTSGGSQSVFLTPARTALGPRFGRSTAVYESTLSGGGGTNWFFTSSFTSITDRRPGEMVND